MQAHVGAFVSRLSVPPHDESDWGYVAEKMTNGLRKCN